MPSPAFSAAGGPCRTVQAQATRLRSRLAGSPMPQLPEGSLPPGGAAR